MHEAAVDAAAAHGTITLSYDTLRGSGTGRLVVHAPAHALEQAEVCALLTGSSVPAIVLADRFDSAPLRVATATERKGTAVVLTCDERVPDGPHFLVPSVSCSDGGPMCTFSLKSGDTSVPPYERTYWFDFDATGKAALVAVAIPIL